MVSDAQKRAKRKWDGENATQVNFTLYPKDRDLIDHVNARAAIEGKAGFFRRLIRQDMEKGE